MNNKKSKSIILVLIVTIIISGIIIGLSTNRKPVYVGDMELDNLTCTYSLGEQIIYVKNNYQISKTDKFFNFESPKSNNQLLKLEVFCKKDNNLILLYTTPGKEFIEPGEKISIDVFDKIKDDYENFMFRISFYNPETKTKEDEEIIEDIEIIKVDKTCYELNPDYYNKEKELKK